MIVSGLQENVKKQIDRQFQELVSLRRHIHEHPELSLQEKETSLLLYTRLGDRGCDVNLGPDGLGVIADCQFGDTSKSPRIAIRADIDALRIQDQKQVTYRSKVDGIMHACGHDVHSAIAFGVISTLTELSKNDDLPWPISLRGIFQPAEEICQGAIELVNAGYMDGISAILAAHVDPSLPVGKLGIRDGVLTASCDEVQFTIQGHGAHAARPHESRDPISAAADLIHALYLHIHRVTDSQESVVLSIGRIAGGESFNVIPEKVELLGTLRTLDRQVREKAMDHIKRIAIGVGHTSQTEITVKFGLSAPSVVNDSHLAEVMRRSSAQVAGEESIHSINRPSMGGEDFAFYLRHAPGFMIRLGCTSDRIGKHGLHTPLFDVDEEVIRLGVHVLCNAVIELSRENGDFKI